MLIFVISICEIQCTCTCSFLDKPCIPPTYFCEALFLFRMFEETPELCELVNHTVACEKDEQRPSDL